MKNTVTYLTEPFLKQYFLIDAICKGFLSETERYEVFADLAAVFCVPMDEETKMYYQVSGSEHYRMISDSSSYERLCRTIEFEEARGIDVGLTELDRVILSAKRESMLVKAELCASKSEARRNVEQGGVTVEGEKVTDIRATFTTEALTAGLLVKRGKKNYRRVILK